MRATRSRAAVCGVAAVAVLILAGGGVADATTLRYGTTTTNPTSTSPPVPSGVLIGATALKSASFTASRQGTSGPNPTTGSCTTGSFSGIVGTNSVNSISFSAATLSVGTCTDNGPLYDFLTIDLVSPSTFTIQYSNSSADGFMTIANPTFQIRVRTSSGMVVTCTAVPVNAGNIVGLVRDNDAGQPTAEFVSLALKTTSASGTCADAIGTGGSDTSVFNFKLGPLIVRSGSPSGSRIGVFP